MRQVNGVKANWFSDAAVVGDDDPLGVRPAVEKVGKVVELENAERLQERYERALDREGALWERGVTCAIKDDPQASCSACPLRHIDPLDGLTPLCEVGIDQENLITRLRILEHERAGHLTTD